MPYTRILTLLLLSLTTCFRGLGQYNTPQNKVWVFGTNAGLNFNSGTPVQFASAINGNIEGCAVVSDVSGNLLFYTNGKTVWNKLNAVMPGGASITPYGVYSTAQAAAIVPFIGNSDRYYIFSLENNNPITTANRAHLTYSILDMTLNGGLGDIVPGAMGIALDSFLSENMIVVPGNGCNFWLLLHRKDTAKYLAYEINSAGISVNPVVSAGAWPVDTNGQGLIKISPNRQKLVRTNWMAASGNTSLCDFDAGAGIVSNCNTLNNSANSYGIEFSSDNTKLYTTSNLGLDQYDVSLPTVAAMAASRYNLGPISMYHCDLKLAPDDKIYLRGGPVVSTLWSNYLNCISAPNLPGASCNYVTQAINLTPNRCYLGLPNVYWTAPGSMLAAISGSNFVCAGSTIVLSNAVAGGTWSSSNTFVATITTGTGVVTGVGAGTSVIQYATACASTSATITVGPLVGITPPNANICEGTFVVFSSSVAGGTWTTGNTTIATVASGSVYGIASGVTLVTYSLAGCSATGIVTVVSAPFLSPTAAVVCVGASASLSFGPSGGTWASSNSAVATVAGGIVFGVTQGVANISYTLGGCTALGTVTVNPTPILAPTAATICVGESLMLSFGPSGGTWSQSMSGIATVSGGGVVSAVVPGSVIVTYTLPGNCFSTTSVAVNEIPVISPASVSLCANSSTTLSYSPAGGTWSSSAPAIATASAIGLVSGVSGGAAIVRYTLGGCSDSSTVTVNPAPAVLPVFTQLCTGASAQLSSTVAGGIWSSSAGSVASVSLAGSISALSVGAAIISYAAIGCVGLATVAVRPPPTSISGRPLLCQGYSTQFSNGVAGGTWSSGSVTIASIDAAGNVGGVGFGSTLISYTTAAGAGCMTTYSVAVVASAGAGTITGPVKVCIGDSIALTDAVAGGSWSSNDPGLATVSASGVVSGAAQGVITISYTVVDTCGLAIAVKTITIGTLPDAGVITGDSVLCVGNITTLSHTAAGGSWFSSDVGMVSATAGGVFTGIGAGNTIIGYYVSNDCGSDTAWYPVRVAPRPSAGVISGLSHVCIGATFPLSNTVAGGSWATSPVGVVALNSGGDVTAVGQGIRTITYTVGPDADGCVGIATHSVTVTTVASFTVTATVTQPLCYGDTTGVISLAVSGDVPPYKYLWSTLDTVASLTHLSDGTYYSSVTETITNCNVPGTFQIASPPQLSITFTVSGDLCNSGKGSITASITGGSSPFIYAWSTGAVTGEITSLHAGVYSIAATDANGCVRSAGAILADTCSSLVLHDVITPNGDGVNDVWVIEGINLYPVNTVQVFDKWGDLIFETTSYQNDWAASGKGGPLPDGTYFYLVRLNAPNINGGQNTFTGSILVKR